MPKQSLVLWNMFGFFKELKKYMYFNMMSIKYNSTKRKYSTINLLYSSNNNHTKVVEKAKIMKEREGLEDFMEIKKQYII